MNNISATLMIVTAVVWGVYDIYVYYRMKKHGDGTKTLSIMITEFSWYSPLLPLVIGFLVGHWFG